MKKTNKLLSILLSLVMLLGLLPTTAFAAEKVIIDSISATVTLPTAGAHPVETGTPGDSSYDIIRIRFSKKDADSGLLTSLEPSDTFEAGATYRINVLFRAKSGFTIEREAKATINGMEAEYWSTITDGYDSRYFGLEYTVPEEITSISVTVPKPVAGGTADTNVITISPAALSVSIAEWFTNKDGVGFVSVDKFTAGKTYYLVIKYDVAEGYTVSESAEVLHGLTGGIADCYSSANTIVITYTVPKTYTVTFAANGGSGTMADVTVISGNYTLPDCSFTAPDDYRFKAWSVGGDEKAVGATINVTANTTVTAVWEHIETKLSFLWNGDKCTIELDSLEDDVIIRAASYDQNRMKEIVEFDAETMSATLTGDTVKVFYWKENLSPVRQVIILTKP